MTRVTQLIHDAGKYLLISVYPLPTHPTHNFTHNNGGNLETLPGWPKKLQHNRPAQSAGQWTMCINFNTVIQSNKIFHTYRIKIFQKTHFITRAKLANWIIFDLVTFLIADCIYISRYEWQNQSCAKKIVVSETSSLFWRHCKPYPD